MDKEIKIIKEEKTKKNKLNKKGIILLSIISGVLLLSIILVFVFTTGKKEEPKKENNKTEVKEDVKEVQIIDVNSNTRPYAVMINCHNGALPQAGLQDAYIVYELMVEGGITRMMALFKDVDVNKIGSMRSARTQYLDYVYENDAIYVHAGGATDAMNRIASEGIDDVNVDGQYGDRDTSLDRSWEHLLFTSTDKLKKGAEAEGIRLTTNSGNILAYQADPIDFSKYEEVKDANKVSIRYSDYRTSNYTYDSEKKVYLRYMNDGVNNDLVTGKQYEVKNIIVYGVNYSNYTYNNYSLYQKIDNVGSGQGYYITEGKAIKIMWEKNSKNEKTIYKVKETGENLVVNDGNTYIQIYPNRENMSIE